MPAEVAWLSGVTRCGVGRPGKAVMGAEGKWGESMMH